MDLLGSYNMCREDVGTFEQTFLNKLNILPSAESMYRYFYILKVVPLRSS